MLGFNRHDCCCVLLPSATKLLRLCFYTCLSFCSRGGRLPQCMLGYHPPDQAPPWEQTPPRSRHHSPGDGYCCGRFASYWNAYLFRCCVCRLSSLGLFTRRDCGNVLCITADGLHGFSVIVAITPCQSLHCYPVEHICYNDKKLQSQSNCVKSLLYRTLKSLSFNLCVWWLLIHFIVTTDTSVQFWTSSDVCLGY